MLRITINKKKNPVKSYVKKINDQIKKLEALTSRFKHTPIQILLSCYDI